VNSQSTAWAVQGMLAAGAGAASALEYLAARQADDGHYAYSASGDQTPIWVTGQVLAAIAGDPFPISPPPREPEEATEENGNSPGAAVPGVISPPATPPVVPPTVGGGTGSPPEPFAPSSPPALGAPALPPSAGGREREGSGPATPMTKPFTASEPKDPSPLQPVGIGLATTGLAIGLPWWLGRRNGW
jgi:hypothetical protein